MMDNENQKVLLPHHEQQRLCTTRLPYRQGRKLTAVKAYSVTKESNHLLIFGVPSLNLRQETKSLFNQFGRLVQFAVSSEHPAERFTETYHAHYEKVQSARVAKKMLDTKNFYGGCLHVCYAPEFESISETKEKLLQRQRGVLNRLKNLEKEDVKKDVKEDTSVTKKSVAKLNMSVENIIPYGNTKRRKVDTKMGTAYQMSNDTKTVSNDNIHMMKAKSTKNIFIGPINNEGRSREKVENTMKSKHTSNNTERKNESIEIIDCTSIENETITNINERLNYKKFGNEIVKKIPVKPVNRIKFNFNS